MVIRLKDFIRSVWNHKLLVFLCILVCIGLFVSLGVKKVSAKLTEQEQGEINAYYSKLEQYELALKDYETCLEEQTVSVNSLQDYVDNSIYMKLDPSAIHCFKVQYGIEYAEGTDSTKVNQAILQYITSGLKEEITDAERLKVKYWDDVLSVSFDANLLVITLMHYDSVAGTEIMDTVTEKLEAKVPEIAAAQGDFSIQLQERSVYDKSDVNVANAQNVIRNNLRTYTSTKADYENMIANQKEAIETCGIPDALKRTGMSVKDKIRTVIKYGIFGLFCGIAIVFLIWFLTGIFGNKVHDEKDFEGTGINVLGVISGGKVKPETERILIDLRLLPGMMGKGKSFLYLSENTDKAIKAAELLKTQFSSYGFETEYGSGKLEDINEAKALLGAGNAVLLVEGGRTTFAQIEDQKKLCIRFQVPVPGVIVIK